MLEVIVSRLIKDIAPSEISGSVAERGKNAGKETWANSMEATKDAPILKPEELKAAREFFAEFGAWDEAEIAAWSHNELDALVLQYAAGDLRELQSLAPGNGLGDINWKRAEKLSNDGVCSGSLFVHNGELYVCLSN